MEWAIATTARRGEFRAKDRLSPVASSYASCIVLDLRELSYRWGNAIARVFEDVWQFRDAGDDSGGEPFPVLVVGSSRSGPGLLPLAGASINEPPDWYFTDLDAAIHDGVRRARAWLEL